MVILYILRDICNISVDTTPVGILMSNVTKLYCSCSDIFNMCTDYMILLLVWSCYMCWTIVVFVKRQLPDARYVIYPFLSLRPSVRPSVHLLGCVLHLTECIYRQTFRPSVGASFYRWTSPPLQNSQGNPVREALQGWGNFCNFQRKLGLSRIRYEIGITNRKSQVADRSVSTPMILSDLERREAKGPFSGRSHIRSGCLT